MIDGIGIDVIEIARIAAAYRRHGARMASRILSEREQAIFEERRHDITYLAGRFAAKEATVKALGSFAIQRPPWNEMEVLPDERGVPQLLPSLRLQRTLGLRRAHVSISHTHDNAAAVVVIEAEKPR